MTADATRTLRAMGESLLIPSLEWGHVELPLAHQCRINKRRRIYRLLQTLARRRGAGYRDS
jgi:hypothetical protein